MGFDPAEMKERGYLLKEPPEARGAVSANKRDQAASLSDELRATARFLF